MKVLLGTYAYNSHVQNIARALHEAELLGAFYTGLVDNYQTAIAKRLRRAIADSFPAVDKQLHRRRINNIPDSIIDKVWIWEGLRTAISKLKLGRVEDRVWEKGDHYLDRKCARAILKRDFDCFFGVEHGSRLSIHAAKRCGKKSVLAFLSPYGEFRERWVDAEYESFPDLMTPTAKQVLKLRSVRNRRVYQEAVEADLIHTNSSVTMDSLLETGLPKEKFICVPLGAPDSIPESSLPKTLSCPLQFIYAGPVSVHKGTHYLLQAWRLLNPNGAATLHFYGLPMLPERLLKDTPDNVFIHGSVPRSELFKAYEQSAVLVFPTLCDGFGEVVTESLSRGLPVITTRNAGARDLIENGKNGFIIEPRSPEALAERMQWCIDNPSVLLDMRRHALATARLWTWADYRRQLISELLQKAA
ncbi:MAG TPA: glycosyltransferase family 4 protein [Blastocatellia bacterium]|nr:glycosyltransferase family 4 protein [Blastocatellia bacterium]